MRISETLELSIAKDELNVNRLEQYFAKETERFRKRVFGEVLQEIEEKELAEAKILIEEWRKEYNQVRPHSALHYRPPAPEAIMTATLTLSVD